MRFRDYLAAEAVWEALVELVVLVHRMQVAVIAEETLAHGHQLLSKVWGFDFDFPYSRRHW